jgi:hypothetical protein
VQSDLAIGGSASGTEVAAVDLDQLQRGHVAEPEEERPRRVPGVLPEPPGDLEVRLLEHVRVVDATGQPSAEPQADHPLETVAVALEQGAQRLLLAGRGAAGQIGVLGPISESGTT